MSSDAHDDHRPTDTAVRELLRRADGFVDESQLGLLKLIITEERAYRLRQFDARFFRELEAVGGVELSRQSRTLLLTTFAAATYHPPSCMGLQRDRLAKRRKKIVEFCNTLMALGTTTQSNPPLFDSLAIELSRTEDELACAQAQTKKQRPKNELATFTAYLAARIYQESGGTTTIRHTDGETFEGPYFEFLTCIWRHLPSHRRPTTPKSFARLARKELRRFSRTSCSR